MGAFWGVALGVVGIAIYVYDNWDKLEEGFDDARNDRTP